TSSVTSPELPVTFPKSSVTMPKPPVTLLRNTQRYPALDQPADGERYRTAH
ncbi:hypothetical protein RCH10_005582, partial [Variovorax sp. GrIS 2.14]